MNTGAALSSGPGSVNNASLPGVLWVIASALPWLLPDRTEPWTTFYSEALCAAVMIPVAAWAVWSVCRPWRIDALSAGLAVAAFVPLLQAWSGLITLPAEARLASQYLSALALILLIAQHAEHHEPSRLLDALFAGLLIAGILSTGIALYQVFGLEGLGIWVAPLSEGNARPTANVGQPNNLSTLLVWGLVATWWAHRRRHIGGAVAVLLAAFLLLGVVLTKSRTGVVAVGALGAAAFLWRGALGTCPQARVLVALALWFFAWLVGFQALSEWVLNHASRGIGDTESAGVRQMILRLALQAISERPWFGYGWNQIGTAHVALAADFPAQMSVQHAHNFVLDLILWNGLPLAGLMVAGLVWWAWKVLRSGIDGEKVLLCMGLGVFLIHASLELPHVLATFLFPAAIMAGALAARAQLPTVVRVPRIVVGVAVALHAGVLALAVHEYAAIETHLTSVRLRAARIGTLAPLPEPPTLWLSSLQDTLKTVRVEPRRGMSADELEHLRRTVTRHPVTLGLLRYAQAAALNGQRGNARWALMVLCNVNPIEHCEAAARDWRDLGSAGYPEIQALPFPVRAK